MLTGSVLFVKAAYLKKNVILKLNSTGIIFVLQINILKYPTVHSNGIWIYRDLRCAQQLHMIHFYESYQLSGM